MTGSFLATFAVRGFAAGATFLMHFLIARLLGATGTGLFVLSLAIMQGGMEIGRLGMNQSLVRFAAPLLEEGDRVGAARFFSAGLTLAAGLGIAAAAVLSLLGATAAPALLPDRAEVWALSVIFVWTAIPMALLGVAAGMVQAFARPAQASALEVAVTPVLASLGLLAASALGEVDAREMAWIYMGSAALASLGGLALCHAKLGLARRPRRAEIAQLGAVGHPLLVVSGARYLVQNVPLLILGMSAALDDAGVFSVAYRLAMALSILLTAVNNVMFARFAVAWRRGERDKLERDLQTSALLLMGAGLPVIAILALFRGPILGLLGEEFVAGGAFLLVLLAGQLVNLLTASTGAVLAMTGHERALRGNSLISGLASLALSALLIPSMGGMGAAIAISAAIALQSALAGWQAWALVGVRVLAPEMFRDLPARVRGVLRRGGKGGGRNGDQSGDQNGS